jgi:hypothetical protein
MLRSIVKTEGDNTTSFGDIKFNLVNVSRGIGYDLTKLFVIRREPKNLAKN